jgi:hypothetical protein
VKYSKANVVLSFMLVGIWASRMVRHWQAGQWVIALVEGALGLGAALIGSYHLDNLKRKDQ